MPNTGKRAAIKVYYLTESTPMQPDDTYTIRYIYLFQQRLVDAKAQWARIGGKSAHNISKARQGDYTGPVIKGAIVKTAWKKEKFLF